MPELPEVETIRSQLCEAGVEGQSIENVSIGWPRTVEPLSPAAFRKQVVGRILEKLSRHGKWLIFELDGEENLLVHLRMTGGFYLSNGARQFFQTLEKTNRTLKTLLLDQSFIAGVGNI